MHNSSISNGSEFQYEKNGSSKDGYNYLGNEKDNFEINFLYSFNVSESFYLNDKYRYVYIFYYDEKLIVRYSNKEYNIY